MQATRWWKAAFQALEERSEQGRKRVLLAELKACRSLRRGKELHARAIQNTDHSCVYVATALIHMYAKCGSIHDARLVFDGMKQPDVVSWNALILGYAVNGKGSISLDLFARMSCAPDSITFVAALKACTSLALDTSDKAQCRSLGREIHSQIGCHLNIYVQNTLIDMYAKCGSLADAREVFDGMKQPNIVSWNALLSGYAENGDGFTALDMFARMKAQGCRPDCRTFVAALKACTSLARSECLKRGQEIHLQVGCHMDTHVQNALIDMYSSCGSMAQAYQVFNSMKQPNVVSWNTLILGYAENGEARTALDLFARMSCAPDSMTFVAALKACSLLALQQGSSGRKECRELGKQIHSLVGGHSNLYVQNALVDMYVRCGSMAEAREVFESMTHRSVVSWTALIMGYAENGEGIAALDLFGRMRLDGCAPDCMTFVAALKACTATALDPNGRAECLERGTEIHSQIGPHSDMYVPSTLIAMYAKCGCMTRARQVFDSLKCPDVFSWTAIILGYAQNGDGMTALDLFARMRSQGCQPDGITFSAALKACGLLGALDDGRKIHAEVIRTAAECDAVVVNSLVDFYGKCGSLVEAQKVFDSHPDARDLVTWNSLLAGYSRLGNSKAAFGLLQGMRDAGLQPDAVTFSCILSCCSHGGLVEKAVECFGTMARTPTVEHYTCMVDILGRSNKLEEAVALLRSMPFSPNAVAWTTVLGACHKWGNVGIGRLAFLSLVSLEEDEDGAASVLMAHIYGSRGMRQEQEMVLGMRNGLGKSWKNLLNQPGG